MFRGNLQRTGYYPAEDTSFRGEIAWKHIVVGGEFKAPAMVHAGMMFCGSTSSNEKKKRFWALDAQSGKPKWSHLLENEMRLVPSAGDDRVIAADGDVLRVFDMENGFEHWTARMKGFVDSVTVYGKMVLVGGRGTGSAENYLWAFHLDSGKKIWCNQFSEALAFYPAIADETLFLATQRNPFGGIFAAAFSSSRLKSSFLSAIDCATGDFKWHDVETPGPIVGTPIWDNDMLYVPYREGISVHDAKTGERLWQWTFGEERISAPAAIKEDTIFCTLGESVVAKDIRTSKRVWQFRVPSAPETDGDETTYLETATAVSIVGDTAVVGMKDGHLYGIDVHTGKNIWKCELDELEEADMECFHVYPKWMPVYGEEMIFIGAGNTLYALK